MKFVTALPLVLLHCVHGTLATYELPFRSYGVGPRYPRERIGSKESGGPHRLSDGRNHNGISENGDRALTLLRNFDTREIKVVYVPTAVEHQATDLHHRGGGGVGSETLRGEKSSSRTHKSTKASIPVIIIERHIGYQIPGLGSPKPPEHSEKDGPEVKFTSHGVLDSPKRDPVSVQDSSDKHSTTELRDESYSDHDTLLEAPSPYHGQGEYRRRYSHLSPTETSREELSDFSKFAPTIATDKSEKKPQKNTGIFVKGGRVLKDSDVEISDTLRSANIRSQDRSIEAATREIARFDNSRERLDSFSTDERSRAFLHHQDEFFDGRGLILKSTPIYPEEQTRFQKLGVERGLTSSRASQVRVAKDRRPEAFKATPDEFVRRGTHFEDAADPPLDGRIPNGFEPVEISDNGAKRPVVNPLTGWVQTPAVRPREGSRFSTRDSSPNDTSGLRKARFSANQPVETSLRSPKRGWRKHARRPSWTLSGINDLSASSHAPSTREKRTRPDWIASGSRPYEAGFAPAS